MEKTLKEVKFEKAWVCKVLMGLRDQLKEIGTIDADEVVFEGVEKDERVTILDMIEATLDNVGAEAAVAEEDDERRAEYRQWYQERGQYQIPKAKAPEGWK